MSSMSGLFHIETFGCQMNVHDSEKIAGILASEGYARAQSPQAAGVVVVNTCSVREKAESKLYAYLGRLGRRKASGEAITIGVMGCVAQQEGEELLARAPYVDFVLGTHQVVALAEVLRHLREKPGAVVETRIGSEFAEIHPSVADRSQHGRALVTIMEGCDKFCTFCVIPYTRGRQRYRKMTAILDEARYLASRGFVEIQLLGQNVNCWSDGEQEFVDLLREMEEVPVEWIRFITSHPAHFSDSIIDWIGRSTKLCPQIHLPVQSGSDRTLERMRREYTCDQFQRIVAALREARPGISLSTDIIVGFPGETEEDFEMTMGLCGAVRFDSMFSFAYSPRKYAAASRWTEDVPAEIKSARLMRLQEIQKLVQTEKNVSRVGSVLRVLVEGRSRKSDTVLAGHSACNRVVNFVATEQRIATGSFVDVRITGAGPNSLFGQQVGQGAPTEQAT